MTHGTLDRLHKSCQQSEVGCTGGGCRRKSGKTARKLASDPQRDAKRYARRKARS